MYIADNSMEIEKSTIQKTQVYKPDGTIISGESRIITEHSLQVMVNERLAFRLVCTPDRLKELVVGRLLTEGIVTHIGDMEQLYICDSGHTARVFLKTGVEEPWFLPKDRPTEPTCCTNNIIYLRRAGQRYATLEKVDWQPEWVFSMAKAFKEDSAIHKTTWGTHSCYLGVAGDIVFSAEDIGRHNAMDKVIGHAAFKEIPFQKCMLFTTGRVPVDMVMKAIAAGMPVLVSKAVPTMEAVALAKEYGLTLICKAWPDQFEVFT